jgi:hypothetical protein
MDWLKAITNVWEGASHNDGHGVSEIRIPHLVFDIDGDTRAALVRALNLHGNASYAAGQGSQRSEAGPYRGGIPVSIT